jgi:SAM-dependent methyltransferase
METAMQPSGSAERQGPLWGARAARWAAQEEKQVATYEEAMRRVGVTAGTRWLDIGCGSGVCLRVAADHGATVAGLDASDELAAIARTRVPGADVRVGDMQSLPFGDDSFDVVSGFNSFFFAADMTAALREAGRVAKPGGAVVIQVWGRPENCDLVSMLGAIGPLRPPRDEPKIALAEPGVLERIAADAGLEPESAFDVVTSLEYPDEATMVEETLSPGGVVEAIEHSGEEAVRDAIKRGMAPFRGPDGAYRLRNEWHYLVARA